MPGEWKWLGQGHAGELSYRKDKISSPIIKTQSRMCKPQTSGNSGVRNMVTISEEVSGRFVSTSSGEWAQMRGGEGQESQDFCYEHNIV